MKEFFWQAFVRCWPLSETCAVEWDAWGVVAAGVVGVTTVLIAVLAWRTSRQAANIAANQHKVAVDLREGQSRILGRLLLHEVTALTAKVESHERVVDSLFAADGSTIRGWKDVRETLKGLQRPLLPSAEAMIEQLHSLPDWLGADLATMISHSRDINEIVRRILDDIHEHQPPRGTGGFGVTYSYSGKKQLIDSLLDQLKFVAQQSRDFVSEFRAEVLGKTAQTEAARKQNRA